MRNTKLGIPVLVAVIVICLVSVCCIVAGLYFFGDTLLGLSPQVNGPSEVIVPADTSNLPEWTVMIYGDADDEILEGDIWFDVNEMELVGSNSQMNIVVQLDRGVGGFNGDGDWSDTRRFLITQDNDLNAINSPVVEYVGEADMGNPQTLVDFATWAIRNYPAKKYALIMSDHGAGWAMGFSDLSSGNTLSLPEITNSVAQIQQSMGGQKFEVLGFDACLMGMVEVFGSLYPYANYMIASQEVEPATGWAYAGWLQRLAQNPSASGRELSQYIVSTYIVEDTLLTLSRSSTEIAEFEADTTLSAIDSARMPDVINAMNQFIATLAAVDQQWVAQGRQYTRSYYSVFDERLPSPFIDLVNFAEIMATTNDPAIVQANEQLRTAISSAIVAEKHGTSMAGSYGISFHFPISDIYVFTEYNENSPLRYSIDAARFLEQSSWDEFLAFHYTGQAFVPQSGQAFEPNRANPIVAPGASEFSIAPVQLSDTAIVGDETLTLSTTVTGDVAYIYFILYFYNPDANAYWVGDTFYYFAENTTTVGGVNMPDYGPSPIQVSYEWTPSLWVLKDGVHEEFALFQPDEYLSESGISTYSLYGQYTPLNGSPVNAKLLFDPDGNLLQVYALPDPDGDGVATAVAVTPQIGDQFEDYVKSYYFDENNETYYDYSLGGVVFTYGEQGFWFESRYLVDGDYAVGFYAVDFDNNIKESYEFFNYQFGR
ncbi:MAG: hypothetical protein IH588_20075 [Anaerolineales bacterium]|nr:hypothetical protein [Anaerolineales bacterium]